MPSAHETNNNYVTKLIIKNKHKKLFHANTQATLSAV